MKIKMRTKLGKSTQKAKIHNRDSRKTLVESHCIFALFSSTEQGIMLNLWYAKVEQNGRVQDLI